MDLLKQCQKWIEEGKEQRVIEEIEAMPADERTPELDSELARAYNCLAEPKDKGLFEKAISLLKLHEEYFAGDHKWNYRMAYAYYFLGQEGLALKYFEKALEARPGDKDTEEFIEDCRNRLALPWFEKNFRKRTQDAWIAFQREEETLRLLVDARKQGDESEKIIARFDKILKNAFTDVAFEVGFDGKKYQLTLIPEGDKSKLFPLIYFQNHAPAAVLECWDIWVGRQASKGFDLQIDKVRVSTEDVMVRIEKTSNNSISLTLYCEKLIPLLHENEDKAWWILSSLTDQALGEINAIALIESFDVEEYLRKGKDYVSLSDLLQVIKNMGIVLCSDAEEYLENSYQTYEMEPVEDTDADWRLDTYIGTTRLPAIIQDYLMNESRVVDEYHADGIAAGFLIYPLNSFSGDERAKEILDMRDALEEAIAEAAGEDAVTFLGGATGLYCGYLDFIAWDISPVLEAAEDFFRKSGLDWAAFHSFRRDVSTVKLFEKEAYDENGEAAEEPQIDPQTGSLLSLQDIEMLESFEEDGRGYFYKMLDYLMDFIERGISSGRFTEKQAHEDLQIALWHAFACLNIDEYEYYYRGAQWMPASEKNAKGCGKWYYRYSVALMYCGKLEESLKYARMGIEEEPEYPWTWLQIAKLESHFGNKKGALEAVKQGLDLVPDDYEFITLQREITEGATLEQMEYHWIDPYFDYNLQEGLDDEAEAKMQSISCILVDAEGLAKFKEIFDTEDTDWVKDSPYCSFHYIVGETEVELVFCMNEAGLSKLKKEWLIAQKECLDEGKWLNMPGPEGETGVLDTVFFRLNHTVSLIYRAQKQAEKEGEEDFVREDEKTRYFQVWLKEDGTPDGPPLEIVTGEDSKLEHVKEPQLLAEEFDLEAYTQEEMEAIENHIGTYLGPVKNVFHELVSTDIHVDICIVKPSAGRDYYSLVTMGMGAHQMNVPEELKDHQLDRAEMIIALPSDWKLDEDSLQDEKWYWPIRLLKTLARLPISNDTWLGWGHTLDHQKAFADDTELCGALLVSPQQVKEGGEACYIGDGKVINFYQVIPLYRDEMDYKQAHNAESLLKKMDNVSFVVHPNRPNGLTSEPIEDIAYDSSVMDDGMWHVESIYEKNLPVDTITAYNHMAIYLRWCIEHNLMSMEFLNQYWNEAMEVKLTPDEVDLRVFIRDNLNGQLTFDLFDEEGEAFSNYYYGYGEEPHFTSDIDDYALKYFGPARYHSDEFKDEAYLFIPFDEEYYRQMAQIIQDRWQCWQRLDIGEEKEPSELAQAIMRYMDCECKYFPPMSDDDPITAALGYAQRLGVREGFVPILIKTDEILWESLMINSDPDNEASEDYQFNEQAVAEYRRTVLKNPVKDGKAVLNGMTRQRNIRLVEDEWCADAVQMTGDRPIQQFSSYWDHQTGMTCPLILAKIPVDKPWDVFAYLPFGGWNECPGTEDLRAISKYWYEQYGAVPAVITHDELEFRLTIPAPAEKVIELAEEHYSFCPDTIEQGPENITIAQLADILRKAYVWYFWWD